MEPFAYTVSFLNGEKAKIPPVIRGFSPEAKKKTRQCCIKLKNQVLKNIIGWLSNKKNADESSSSTGRLFTELLLWMKRRKKMAFFSFFFHASGLTLGPGSRLSASMSAAL